MIIFWRLLFGHLLADFTFQFNVVNRWKRSSLWGMLLHCATHPVFYLWFTWPYINEVWVELPGVAGLRGWGCILIVFALHFIEDQWRVFTIFRYRTPDNTLYFLWDQFIHYAVIFLVIPHGGAAELMPETWPVLGCLFVFVTHASTVLIYFIEKDLYDREFPGTQEKYFMMAERLVLAGCMLIPGLAWPALGAAWLGVMYYVRKRRLMDVSWFSLWSGAAVAVLCGLAARMIYY
ncbi:MAG: DUF3307 domain-containing protein [Elusimicrobia bacterium]|nr:DUF3307 domain-containing protein [Elusimicrobiota bacterium]